MINIDHGTLPGSTKQIEEKLDINDLGFGILGSVVYAGLTFGSGFATLIFNRGEWIKPTLGTSLIFNAICLYAFTSSSSFLVCVLLRGLTGFMQVFVTIFYPVWADAYGTEKQKSIWLTILLLASPLGVVLGYTLTFYMQKYLNWEWSFYIQAVAILPCAACYLITPSKYINI
jgi:predicted MFS family arabinose efflux permease